jgi:hypothetical protein
MVGTCGDVPLGVAARASRTGTSGDRAGVRVNETDDCTSGDGALRWW